ncbi:uncharacterized protein EV422DRAFT_563743 [Fimicolochytrium jonesii]|uniref:uncharacterized protein n=1 Tax=Fimicolochytrium jonesii TaxID=1396493 RepID=UPI0022FEECEA|nr:uncharacterized protein EV422DRAFT_563743 [Fimicolochytrium jonesii]KAI8825924.1 hypothetical protein EV422DRAFT_563743 [Fimicolochytrium jonesii]
MSSGFLLPSRANGKPYYALPAFSVRPIVRCATTSSTNPEENEDPATAAKRRAAEAKYRRRREFWMRLRFETLDTIYRITHAIQSLGYVAVLIGGLGVLGGSFYYLSLDIVDQTEAWSIYEATAALIADDARVRALVGDDAEVMADPTAGKGRRRLGSDSLSHNVIQDADGKLTLCMRFYVVGARGTASVHVELVPTTGDTADVSAASPALNSGSRKWRHQLIQVIPAYKKGRTVTIVDTRPVHVIQPEEVKKTGLFGFAARAAGSRRSA